MNKEASCAGRVPRTSLIQRSCIVAATGLFVCFLYFFQIKEAETVPEAKVAIEMAEDCLSIIGAFRAISTLQQRDMLVQSAVEYYVDGRCNAALQQYVVSETFLFIEIVFIPCSL